MRFMENTDWKFDFSALPRYDVRDKAPYVYDKFFEIEEFDTLCGIYSIVEASMLNYIGALVLLKSKADPRIILNISDRICFTDNFSKSKSGRYIFLQASVFDETKERINRPIVIIDLLDEVFSFIQTDNCNPLYEIVEQKEWMFRVIADETQKKGDKRLRKLARKKIKLKSLRWHDLNKLQSLPKLLFD